MAREGKNVLQILLKNFFDSLKPRKFRGDLIGTDHFGNKYFEIRGATKKSSSRYFEPIGGEANFDKELPAEWESWLRGRRPYPPTVEEIERNLQLAKQARENAKILEAEYKTPQPEKPPTGNTPFPKLEGYELHPGDKKS